MRARNCNNQVRITAFKNQSCSGGKNTDPVGVTWPRGGTQKSRVGEEQYPRTTGQIAIWASGGSESESERPPAAPRSIAFARQWRARHKGGSGQTKGHGSGCRSAPEIASAPAASELPIGGSRRVDRGAADLGPIYMARKRAADISIRVCSVVVRQLYKRTSWLEQFGFEYEVLQYWLSVLPVFRRVELRSVDEPSRSATEGRSSEGLLGYSYTSSVQSQRVALAESENQKTSAKEIAINKSFWTPIAAHAVEDTPDPPLIIQSTYLVAGRTNVICSFLLLHIHISVENIGMQIRSNSDHQLDSLFHSSSPVCHFSGLLLIDRANLFCAKWTTVVARIFVHFERAVATCSVSGVREPEDVREGDRRQQEFLDPDRSPRRGRYT
ncbi:hypothetical protein T06_3478 [Trichinella sp. T6]|nr:hypothetical protein T06_3478 [Trichinella sp. T6]